MHSNNKIHEIDHQTFCHWLNEFVFQRNYWPCLLFIDVSQLISLFIRNKRVFLILLIQFYCTANRNYHAIILNVISSFSNIVKETKVVKPIEFITQFELIWKISLNIWNSNGLFILQQLLTNLTACSITGMNSGWMKRLKTFCKKKLKIISILNAKIAIHKL